MYFNLLSCPSVSLHCTSVYVTLRVLQCCTCSLLHQPECTLTCFSSPSVSCTCSRIHYKCTLTCLAVLQCHVLSAAVYKCTYRVVLHCRGFTHQCILHAMFFSVVVLHIKPGTSPEVGIRHSNAERNMLKMKPK